MICFYVGRRLPDWPGLIHAQPVANLIKPFGRGLFLSAAVRLVDAKGSTPKNVPMVSQS